MRHALTALLFLATLASARAETVDGINYDMGTPPIVVTHHAMAQRFSRLIRFYQPGIMGVNNQGMVAIRPGIGDKLTLAQRQIAEKLIDAENHDRDSMAQAVADANGRRDAMSRIRAQLTRRWQGEMRAGWWIQNDQGEWVKKP
ncbi:DUF1318 domain-containing protein [Denitratisoma oestradiolicum]|uniref:DUF1318 domain-containing protein n=1 Tax=Denitratisoma oestradiolicum TaxID=311182 RepID=A0A6S6XYW2_9PROT|nr:DUF1318 domain-containing protein [Denitratisoma oestradiolicum]TWO80336.1 hypothetical protein CBW56_09510 [Denitratisoma oestradiolicum]CAB1370133.1 conserved exported protein of unknown function [Denitratisoma oestradiolicum]